VTGTAHARGPELKVLTAVRGAYAFQARSQERSGSLFESLIVTHDSARTPGWRATSTTRKIALSGFWESLAVGVNGRSFVSSSILARADEALHQDYSLAPAHVMSDIQIQEVLQNKN